MLSTAPRKSGPTLYCGRACGPRRRYSLHPVSAALLLSAVLMAAAGARASDPSSARYGDDPSKVLWFLHLTDTHIDTSYYAGEELRLEWALTTVLDVINPWFVVVTGDLTDASNGLIPGWGPQEDEWQAYRGIVDRSGMTYDFYYDIPGNHDAFSDGGLSSYLDHSLQGSVTHTTQPDWRLDLPFGSYHFVTVATPDNRGYVDPFDTPEITSAEYDEIAAKLAANADSTLTLAFGHHDYESADGGGGLDELLSSYGVGYYFHGHNHDYRARVTGHNVLIQRVDSLGKGETNNICVHAVDDNAWAHACVPDADPWPIAVISAPVDARLGEDDDVDNPYAVSVPTTCEAAPLRALVFDPVAIGTVTAWWDSGDVTPFTRSAAIPEQWTASFDAREFSAGVHTLTVEIIGSRTRDVSIQVLFADRPCDVHVPPPEEDAPEPVETAEETPEAESPVDTAPDQADETAPETVSDAVPDAPDDLREDTGGNGDISGGGCACRLSV
jgi:hypothetical protein